MKSNTKFSLINYIALKVLTDLYDTGELILSQIILEKI
jgi:hypothetical protein